MPSLFQRLLVLTRPWPLFVISFLLHSALVVVIGHYRTPILWENGAIADHLFVGEGFSAEFSQKLGPTSWQAPGYPYVLLAVWDIFGKDNPTGYLALSLVQALAIASTIFPMGRLTERWFGSAAGSWARVITCLMPLFFWYPTRLHHTAFVMALHPWLLWGWLAVRDRASVGNTLLTGVGTGVAGLVQPVLLGIYGLLSFFLALGAVRRGERRGLAGVLIAGVLTLLVLTPWTIRNYRVHHRLLLVKSSAGKEFWVGNNPMTTGTAYAPGGEGEVTNVHPPKAMQLYGKVSEIELMEAMGHEAMDYVRAEPGAFVQRTLKKIVWLWTVVPVEYTRSSLGGEARKFRLVQISYWLAFVALAITARVLGGKWACEYVWVLALYVVMTSLAYGLTHVGQARFRGEVEFILVPAVAAGCALLAQRVLRLPASAENRAAAG
ncbi:MAG: hypothetical protein QOE70_1002 [Chthoniobacter sp.]|jgi:hypothetical protein|nr:hypothetical protein [Chthoniobacter sp.]